MAGGTKPAPKPLPSIKGARLIAPYPLAPRIVGPRAVGTPGT